MMVLPLREKTWFVQFQQNRGIYWKPKNKKKAEEDGEVISRRIKQKKNGFSNGVIYRTAWVEF